MGIVSFIPSFQSRWVRLGQTTILFGILLASGVFAEEDCEMFTSCTDCLQGSCGWIDGSFCMESCSMIADASCYSMDSFRDSSIAEVCAISATEQADAGLCGSQLDCTSCVGTVLSDGESTCMWLEEFGFCQSACGMGGCGTSECADREPEDARPDEVVEDAIPIEVVEDTTADEVVEDTEDEVAIEEELPEEVTSGASIRNTGSVFLASILALVLA